MSQKLGFSATFAPVEHLLMCVYHGQSTEKNTMTLSRFFAMKHGNSIFFEYGTKGRDVKWRSDPQARSAFHSPHQPPPFRLKMPT